MDKVLVVGGAGYIGSHMVLALQAAGMTPVVLDDFSMGHAVPAGVKVVRGRLGDAAVLRALFEAETFTAVMHFGAFIQVGESVKDPAKYYQNNLADTLNLLDAMREASVNRLIFSSTAAVFGEPVFIPMDESHPKSPVNPYGRSKWMVEQILQDYDRAYGLKSVCFRYFNAAGADPDARAGECHEPETHLIPLVLDVARGKRPHIAVFGQDYDTPDGTCIRDYIHVSDLCDAHLLGLKHLVAGGESRAYNLGNGQGFSVRAVIQTAEAVTGRSIAVLEGPRRDGDPARLVADATLAKQELGWAPRYPELDTIVRHAWAWTSSR